MEENAVSGFVEYWDTLVECRGEKRANPVGLV